jgi:transcriptional regulator NrdR family protein
VVSLNNLKVIKKDGSEEDFDLKKVNVGIVKSGATKKQAEKVAEQVENWAGSKESSGVSRRVESKSCSFL